MTSSALAFGVALLSALLAARAAAQSTPLVVAGGLVDLRSATAAPLLLLRWPLGETAAASVSQTGWTSALELSVGQNPELAWHSAIELTPDRAHLSHDVYAADGVRPAASFDHSLLRVRSGVAWQRAPIELRAHIVIAKHWISGAEWRDVRAFDAPFAGIESAVRLSNARVLDPFEDWIEGALLRVRGAVLAGDEPSADTDLTVRWGRVAGPVFFVVSAKAFWVSLDTPASNVLIGGSWDVLGADALWGHALGAYRLPRGAASTGGIDFALLESLRLGIRASVLVGSPSPQTGLGVQLHGAFSGVHAVAALSTDPGRLGEGVAVSGGISAALLFLQ
jgi:hypothetical protein